MNKIKDLSPLFTAGIFLLAFLALLLSGFNLMLGPIKENQARFEKRLDRIEAKLDQILTHKKPMANLK